ncbi:MAG: single-stranded DNA-binding protein [Chitinophagales bacterium]
MLNRVILIGRLTHDPEIRYTTSGVGVCTFTLAVNRSYANQAGERTADFIDIVTWRQLAETCANYLTKGKLIAVEGRLQVRTYETQEGQKRKAVEVVADAVKFLERMSGAQSPKETHHESDEWENLGKEIEVGRVDRTDEEVPF